MSRIRANQITNKNANGAVTATDGFNITGVCTATSFSGTVPSSSLSGALPALDGSALTGITAGTSLSGSTNNTVCTVTGANAIQGESNVHIDSNGRLIIADTDTANAFSGGDDLVIGNNNSGTRSGLSIVSHSAQDGGIYFSKGNSTDAVRGQIVYQHDGNGGFMRLYTDSDERVRITATGQLEVGSPNTINSGDFALIEAPTSFNSGETIVTIAGNSTTTGPRLNLQNRNTGANACSEVLGADAGGQSTSYIRFNHIDQTNNHGEISFGTRNAQGTPPEERVRITKDGNLSINTTANVQKLRVYDSRGAAGYKTALFESNDTANGTRVVIANTGSTAGRGLGINVGGQSYGPGQDRASLGWYNPDNTYSYLNALTLTADGVMAHGQFANFAYSSLPAFFNIINGARVNTGGAQQYAAPKGGFCDNARYELEASLISYSTSAQQTIQAQNGAQLKISDSRSNWSYYNNLPNYLLGHAATDCINTSNYTLTLKATMTVFLQRSSGWNAVPLSGWELLESNTNIYPGSTDSRLYVKTLAAGSYSGWDSDSAMYFFVL